MSEKTIKKTGDFSKFNALNPFTNQSVFNRAMLVLKLSLGLNCMLIVAIIFLIISILNLFPLKKVEVALVEIIPSSNQLVTIKPLNPQIPGFQILLETISKKFIINLLSIDEISQKARFDEAYAMMDFKPLKEFKSNRIDTKAIENFLKDGLVRNIIVESCDPIEGLSNNLYKFSCEFIQRDTKNNSQEIKSQKKLRAYIAFTLREKEVKIDEKYNNPLGVFVLEFAVKERE